MKIFWNDVETTGLDPKRNDIISLACIIEIDGVIKEEFKLNIQPFDWNNIEMSALKINGITIEQLKTFILPKEAHKKLKSYLKKYVDPYNRNDKFQFAGYNNDFDIKFMSEFFKKCGDKYFGPWIDYHRLDPQVLLQFLHLKGDINLPNYKLETVAKYFGININAHDAMSDIKATREIVQKLIPRIKYIEKDNSECPNETENKTICNKGYACDGCPCNKDKKGEKNADK